MAVATSSEQVDPLTEYADGAHVLGIAVGLLLRADVDILERFDQDAKAGGAR